MIVLMKCLNEEKVVKRCIGDFHDERWVERIIVIDGGSTDYTVQELKLFSKVVIYVHPWLDWYHDMEIIQSNIALSYIPHERTCFILDFDERMSPELKKALQEIDTLNSIVPGHLVNISRRTYEVVRYPDSPYALVSERDWPSISHQIGQYPDYQARLLCRIPQMHWINSPHHVLDGFVSQSTLDADIIHYEKDDYRDRERIEKKWLRAQTRRKELGLVPDKFETTIDPRLYQYSKSDYWLNPKG